jgi:D-amino-acid dehydrogenase
VTLVAPHRPGDGGAAIGSAGLLATQTVQPLAMPGVLATVPRMLTNPDAPLSVRLAYLPRLLPWLIRFLRASRPAEVERLSIALANQLSGTFQAYEPLLREAHAEDLVLRRGLVTVYRTAEQVAAARREIELRRRRGIRLEQVEDGALRQLLPALSRDYRYGIFYPDCGHTVDPAALVRALAGALTAGGGAFVRASARGFVRSGDSVRGVITDSGEHAADAVVVAAGAWSRPLARQLGWPVPLDYERGYHVTLPEPNVEMRLPVIVGDIRFAITPMQAGLRLAGTVEFAGLEAAPNPRRHALLANQAQRCLPGLNTAKASYWMGFRPSLPDSLPVIGRSPTHTNVYFAFGHGHLGLTSAAVTGAAIADLAAARTPALDLAPFSIARFH